MALTDITLTATPASEANSTESTGLRIDGRDACTQVIPAGVLKANKGWIRWRPTFRHANGTFLSWLEATDVYNAVFWGDANNYISLRHVAANNIRLEYNAGGAGVQTGTWQPTTIAAATTYLFEVKYTGSRMQLYVNGTAQITINAAVAFTTIPTVGYWGSNNSSARQGDLTFAAP